MGLFKPFWTKDSDSNKYRAKIKKIKNQKKLARIVVETKWNTFKEDAANNITDPVYIAKILNGNEKRAIRVVVINNLRDPQMLENVARGDADPKARAAAIKNLADKTLLYELARTDALYEVRTVAICKLYDFKIFNNNIHNITDDIFLFDIAVNDTEILNRTAAAYKITNQDALREIANNNEIPVTIRKIAIASVNTQIGLAELAAAAKDGDPREEAIIRLTDHKLLLYVATNSKSAYVRLAAINKIDGEAALLQIARAEADDEIRLRAIEKIGDALFLNNAAIADRSAKIRKYIAEEKVTDDIVLGDMAISDGDTDVRLAAAKKIRELAAAYRVLLEKNNELVFQPLYTHIKQPILWEKLAVNAAAPEVRAKAAEKINDIKIIRQISKNDGDGRVRTAAAHKLETARERQSVYIDVAWNDNYYISRKAAIPHIADQNVLYTIAVHDASLDNRLEAASHITEQRLLKDLVLYSRDIKIKTAAVQKIDDAKLLKRLVLESSSKTLSEKALLSLDQALFSALGPHIGKWAKRQHEDGKTHIDADHGKAPHHDSTQYYDFYKYPDGRLVPKRDGRRKHSDGPLPASDCSQYGHEDYKRYDDNNKAGAILARLPAAITGD